MTGEASLAKTPAVADDSPRTTADPGSTAGSQDGFDAQQILALARHPPPGASVYSPTAAPTAALNSRSCVTCRRRKVRCDKHMPCSNCRRGQIPCIFPAPGRAPRRPRPKDPNAPAKQPSSEREREMMKRLRKLEGIVEELSGQLEVDSVRHPYSPSNSPEAGPSYARDDHTIGGRLGPGAHAASVGGAQDSPGNGPKTGGRRLPVRPPSGTVSEPDLIGKTSPEAHKPFGRLVLHENGVARYVSSSLWSSINDELDELRKASQDLGDEDSDASDLDASPDSADHDKALMDHQSFIHGYRSADVDLRPLHPLPSQIPYIWQVYRENVDPILKIIHAPTMSKLIKDIRDNMDNLTPSTEALMFSIYYAAVTSLDEDEVVRNFGAEKRDLIQRYRFAVEQALAKAEFLTKPDLTVFQAFLLFLVIVRRQDDTRFAWTLTGLLIRLSQALGLHRDGTHFSNLAPFEIEMRRRLFWAVCILDLRSAEDQGADLTIVERSFDTQLPLNINDDDISPDSQSLPEPREGTSDMAFSLIRYEIMALARRLHIPTSDWTLSSAGDADKSLEEREALLSEVYQRVQQRLLLRDSSNPMFWVTSNVTSIVFAKMTLVIYHPMLFPGPGYEELAEDVRSRLLNAVIDIFEYSYVLASDPRCKQWRWLFQTWSHWHALAYALIEVSHRRWGPKTERVWSAINLLLSSPNSPELEKLASHHAVWLPLKKLYFKVKKHREAELARLQADPRAARELDLHDQSVISPASFFATPTSLTGLCAVDHWRKLVNLPSPPEEHVRSPEQQPQHAPPLKPETEQPMQESNTVSNGPAVGSADLNELDLMKYLDVTMSSPSALGPLDHLAPLWDSSLHEQFARTAFLGYSPAHPSRGDAGIGFERSAASPSVNVPAIAASVAAPGYMQQQQQTQPAMVQTPLPGDNPALWLWPISGSPDILRMPSANGEDMDVNMDETFDWQRWGQNLGRYELEANGGRAGSTWAPGL